MTVQITHVRYASTTNQTHQTITDYKWIGLENNSTNVSNKAALVDWLDHRHGRAVVGSGPSRVDVGTVHPDQGSPYLRTHADGQWNNNLLSLPTF